MVSLRTLYISECDGLSGILSGLEYCASLQDLRISGCRNLTSIEIGMPLTSLKSLRILTCPKLESITSSTYDDRGGFEFITNASLEVLSIVDCESLHSIPDLQSFISLRQLTIRDCGRISQSLVSGGQNIPNSVEELSLSGVSTTFPSLNDLPASLRKLATFNCEGILGGLERFAGLHTLDIQSSPNLTSIEITHGAALSSLQELSISGCPKLSSIPALQHFPSLRKLDVYYCPNLISISSSISHSLSGLEIFTATACLEELSIQKCDNLQSLPELYSFTSLRRLTILECGKLQHLPAGLHTLTHLKDLVLGPFWEELDSFPDFQVGSSQLKSFCIQGWPKLKSLPPISTTSLSFLSIEGFDGVEALPEWLGNLSSLTMLEILDCKNLVYLPSLKAMQRLINLQSLQIRGCPLLKESCKEDSGPEWSKISHIPDRIGF